MSAISEIFDLTGRVCVVTGSTKGIGRATTERMLEHGAKVVITSRQPEDAQARARELNDRFGADRALGLGFELENRATGRPLIDTTLQHWGRIDTLMCNAARSGYGRLEDLGDDVDDLDVALQANVRNNAALARLAVPAMRDQGGGSIIFVLSTLGFFPSATFLPYSVAKAALAHLTRILSVDLGPDNIRVNAIVPGSIRTATPMQANAEASRIITSRIPLRRAGAPDEVASFALLLASPAGAYATGQSYVIDGGQLLDGMEKAREGFEYFMAWRAEEARKAAG